MDEAARLAVALGVGLLLGAERERHKGRGPERGAAGIRTFALTGLLGGLSWQLGGSATAAVTLTFVGAAALVGYLREGGDDPGLTSEVALVVAFLLGALAQERPALAAGCTVAVAILLAARHRLHTLVRDALSTQELHDGLLFAACALIVLPLMPDEGVGPGGALVPRTVWLLVVIVMALQGTGYIALRVLGARFGLLLVGFIGGFVSSTATIGTMGARAAREPDLGRAAAAAGVASSVATVVLLALVVGAVDTSTLRELAVPLVLAGAAALGYAGLSTARALAVEPEATLERGRAFDLRVAVLLAITVSAVLLASSALNEALGQRGLALATGVAGLADSQSAAISAATLAAEDEASTTAAAMAVLTALTTNTLSKGVVAVAMGGRGYAVQVGVGLALILAGAWGGWAVTAA